MAFVITETTKHMDGYDSSTFTLEYIFDTYEAAVEKLLDLKKAEREQVSVEAWRSTFNIKDTRLHPYAS